MKNKTLSNLYIYIKNFGVALQSPKLPRFLLKL